MASFTKLYLTKQTAAYSPATFRGAWDDTAGQITRQLTTGPMERDDTIATTARTENTATNNWDVLLFRGVSLPLAAQTLSGNFNVMLGVMESGTASNLVYHVHVYVTQGDTDTPRGTLITDYIDSSEWDASVPIGKALASAQAMASLGISAGDRIVVEIGYQAQNTLTTNSTGTMYYGTLSLTGQELTAGADPEEFFGYVSFSNAINHDDLTDRITQLAVDVINSGSKDQRISQFLAEAVNPGTKEQRISQFCLELVSSNLAIIQPNVFVIT